MLVICNPDAAPCRVKFVHPKEFPSNVDIPPVPISCRDLALPLPNSPNRLFPTVRRIFTRRLSTISHDHECFLVKACYGERFAELRDATFLWNERVMRGIPAIVAAEGVGSVESMHMQMDVRLIVSNKK